MGLPPHAVNIVLVKQEADIWGSCGVRDLYLTSYLKYAYICLPLIPWADGLNQLSSIHFGSTRSPYKVFTNNRSYDGRCIETETQHGVWSLQEVVQRQVVVCGQLDRVRPGQLW